MGLLSALQTEPLPGAAVALARVLAPARVARVLTQSPTICSESGRRGGGASCSRTSCRSRRSTPSPSRSCSPRRGPASTRATGRPRPRRRRRSSRAPPSRSARCSSRAPRRRPSPSPTAPTSRSQAWPRSPSTRPWLFAARSSTWRGRRGPGRCGARRPRRPPSSAGAEPLPRRAPPGGKTPWRALRCSAHTCWRLRSGCSSPAARTALWRASARSSQPSARALHTRCASRGSRR
jgi:hypothetical protein